MKYTLKHKWALFGVATFIVLVLFVLYLSPNKADPRFDPVILRQSNLRTIDSHLHAYAKDHGGIYAAPDDFVRVWATISPYWPDPVLGPDDTQDDIWMCPIPWPDRRIPEGMTRKELAKIPMLHERVGLNPDGTSVAFWDGTVRLLSNEEFERLIDVDQSICLGCQLPIPEFMKNQEP